MIRLGVVTGLAREAAVLRAAQSEAGGCLLVSCAGADPDRAGAAAGHLVEAGCGALLSFGVAGGLATGLRPGDVVVADAVVAPDGGVLIGDALWRERLVACLGAAVAPGRRIAGMRDAVLVPAAKTALREQTGAVAVDMESDAVARVAGAAGLPFLAVRAIVDPADVRVPAWLAGATTPDGSARVSAVLGGLARSPGDLVAVMRLGLAFGAAVRGLRRVAVDAGPLFQLFR